MNPYTPPTETTSEPLSRADARQQENDADDRMQRTIVTIYIGTIVSLALASWFVETVNAGR